MQAVKKKIFNIIQIGNKNDVPSTMFDYGIVLVIAINLITTLFSTFKAAEAYETAINVIEAVTVVIFTIEYALRIWTSDCLYPDSSKGVALLRYVFSFYGLIELLTFLPFYLPFIFPAGAVAFRMFRVIRILRLFRINAQYDAFNVIISVLKEKRNQLLSSIAMILILMISASLCMYSLEHDAQPDIFQNAFSGIWWAASTLLTIGYGDIYPLTIAGKIMAIIISFLGVGMVAIPTGIISAGFVEQYTKAHELGSRLGAEKIQEIKKGTGVSDSNDPVSFVTHDITPEHHWANRKICEISLQENEIITLIIRENEEIIPHGGTTIRPGDCLMMYRGK
jgi:voltage-gated potassium channel